MEIHQVKEEPVPRLGSWKVVGLCGAGETGGKVVVEFASATRPKNQAEGLGACPEGSGRHGRAVGREGAELISVHKDSYGAK